MNEAMKIARMAFRANAANNLTVDEMEEFGRCSVMASGSPSDDWQDRLGFVPETRDYYEYGLYKPSDVPPYVEKYYAKILVSRDRKSDFCKIIWHPQVERRNGS